MMLDKKQIRKIAIFRALQLGDLLCSVPAFRSLRKAFPGTHITILGLPWMKSFVKRFSNYIDEFIWFPGYPGLPEQPVDEQATVNFLQQIISAKFDLVLQMQGNGSIVNPMIELFGARYVAGFCVNGHYCPDSPFFIEYPDHISEIRRHLKLMAHLGIDTDGDELEFPISKEEQEEFAASFGDLEPHKYICVHPGSRGAWRQWPTTYFAKVADRCGEKGWKIVLTGTNDEMPIVQDVASKMNTDPVIAAGKTSLGAVGALLKNAGGLVSNCTGVSHIASAVKTKSVIISMDGEPERWKPLNENLHTIIDWTKDNNYESVRRAVDERFASV
jgi:ADP-heptose:LPS heptosyltransferase